MTVSPNASDDESRRYKEPADGLKALEGSYGYWTSKITDISFQSCVALIAANWAAHSSSAALLKNSWALSSIGAALAAVLVSLIGAHWIALATYDEFYVAANNRAQWKARWEASERIPSEWPYSPKLVCLGKTFTWFKVALPVLGGALFVVGALVAPTAAKSTSNPQQIGCLGADKVARITNAAE